MNDWYEALGHVCDLEPDQPGSITQRPHLPLYAFEINPSLAHVCVRRFENEPAPPALITHVVNYQGVHLTFHSVIERCLGEVQRLRAIYEEMPERDPEIRARVLHLELSMIAEIQRLSRRIKVPDEYVSDLMGGLFSKFVQVNAWTFTWAVAYCNDPGVQRHARNLGVV